MTIGERVAQLLKEQGKMAKDLAAFLGISASSVTGWAHGSYPSSQHIIKITEFLGVSVEYLLTGADAKKDADAITGISDDALKVGCLWERLDAPGQAIILGDIYRRLEAASGKPVCADGQQLKKAR